MDNPTTIVRELRGLMPGRQLALYEARSVAERQASRLHELLGLTDGPVDLTPLMELPRVEVRVDVRLARLGISGTSESHRGGWVITINRADAITRRRFSLGHEFKHVLDHPFVRVLYPNDPVQTNPTAEATCDYFSACLLMPRMWIKRLWFSGYQDIDDLSTRFRVSVSAMTRRLQDIGLIERPTRHGNFRPFETARYFRAAPRVTLLGCNI